MHPLIRLFSRSSLAALLLGLASPLQAQLVYAIQAGQWNDDIWSDRWGGGIVPGLRPLPENSVFVVARVVVTLQEAAEVKQIQNPVAGGTLEIDDGGELTTAVFAGSRGEASGTTTVKGGVFTVKNEFSLAGARASDNASGEFIQTGGEVNILAVDGLKLTRINQVQGTYRLQGGTLNITQSDLGISNGDGTGNFEWTAGTLNTTAATVPLENTGSGNLSPGGDGKVGTTRSAGEASIAYIQAATAVMTIDIAGSDNYDQLIWKNENGGCKVGLANGTTVAVRLLENFHPGFGSKFDVIKADEIEMGSVTLAGADGKRFKAEVVTTKDGKTLRLTYGK